MILGWIGLGVQELLLLLLIIIVLFGAKRIPELAKGLGEGIRNFRTGMRGDDNEQERKNDASGPRGNPNA